MKKYLIMLVFLGYAIVVQADDTANQFALQAGNIAGAAEQCGQEITTLITRSKEAINAITPIPSDQVNADAIFDKSVADALANQSTVMRKWSCSDVLTTYNSLPLLRSDYKQSVIAVLAAHHAQTASATNQAQTLVTAQSQPTEPLTSQAQMPQQDQSQQEASPMQSALANEMPITSNSVQSYVSADDNNNIPANNNVAPTINSNTSNTATPSSDIISVTQAFNQGNSNLSPSSGVPQNSIANISQ